MSEMSELADKMATEARRLGEVGSPAIEQERALFEAWMAGHCWALSAHWNGHGYVSDLETTGDLDPRAMGTRRLWAAWRDRAALAAWANGQAETLRCADPACLGLRNDG